MVPTGVNVATGTPRSKVKNSNLSSTDKGQSNCQKKIVSAGATSKSKGGPGVMRSHFLKSKNPSKIPYKAIACAAVQFLIGTFLLISGCFLLAGYVSHVGANRAIPVLIVGILVFLPGFYHLLITYRACRGCQDCSYDDLPDYD